MQTEKVKPERRRKGHRKKKANTTFNKSLNEEERGRKERKRDELKSLMRKNVEKTFIEIERVRERERKRER